MSLSRQHLAEREQGDPHLGRPGRRDVGVVGQQGHAEGGQPLRDQDADTAEPEHPHGLARRVRRR